METQAELEVIYTEKMRRWADQRLAQEFGYVADRAKEGDECWGTREVMAAWKKCLNAEAARRGMQYVSTPTPRSSTPT